MGLERITLAPSVLTPFSTKGRSELCVCVRGGFLDLCSVFCATRGVRCGFSPSTHHAGERCGHLHLVASRECKSINEVFSTRKAAGEGSARFSRFPHAPAPLSRRPASGITARKDGRTKIAIDRAVTWGT